MPYGFYQLVRFVAMIGFAILAFQANEQKQQKRTLIYGSLALLFQPFLKGSLGRALWNVIDLIVAVVCWFPPVPLSCVLNSFSV